MKSPKKSTMNSDRVARWPKRSGRQDINQNPQFQLNNLTSGTTVLPVLAITDQFRSIALRYCRQQQSRRRWRVLSPWPDGSLLCRQVTTVIPPLLLYLFRKKPNAPPSTKYSLKRFEDGVSENAISSSFVSNSNDLSSNRMEFHFRNHMRTR